MMEPLQLIPLATGEPLEGFQQLLGGTEFGGCYCAVWTHFGEDWVTRCRDPRRPNLEATRESVAAGRRPGFLVRQRDRFVAWTGSGPKSEFPLLSARLGARVSRRDPRATWIVGCLAIAEDARGAGLSERIIEHVIDLARAQGARWLEAYPTDPWDEPRSYRGALASYLRLGFEEVERERDGDSAVVLVERALE